MVSMTRIFTCRYLVNWFFLIGIDLTLEGDEIYAVYRFLSPPQHCLSITENKSRSEKLIISEAATISAANS